MSPELFGVAARKMRRVQPKTVEVARRILVDGESLRDVEKDSDVTYARIAAILRQFEEVAEKIVEENNLVVVEAAVTPKYAEEIRKKENKILSEV